MAKARGGRNGRIDGDYAVTKSTEPGSSRPNQAAEKKFPLGPVAIGIIGGGVLGSLLAWGIIGIVHWRRDAAAQAEREAGDAEARRLMEDEAARKALEGTNDGWRKWATGEAKP